MGQKLKRGAKERSKAVFAVARAVAKSAARVIKAAKMWAKTGSIAWRN